MKLGDVIKIKIGILERKVVLTSGPTKLFANRPEFFQGEVQLENNDPYGEPYTIMFNESDVIK